MTPRSDPIDNNITGIHQIDAHEQQPAPNPSKLAGPCFGCGHSGHVIKNCRKTARAARNRGNRAPNKIVDPCETCGKKTTQLRNATLALIGQTSYSGGKHPKLPHRITSQYPRNHKIST